MTDGITKGMTEGQGKFHIAPRFQNGTINYFLNIIFYIYFCDNL